MRRDIHAQLTLFFVIGLFLILSIFLATNFQDKQPLQNIASEFNGIKLFIEECIAQTTNDAIELISFQGGYFTVENPIDDEFTIPYYFRTSAYPKIPSKERIESEIEIAIESLLPQCIDNFETFNGQGFDFSTETITAEVSAFDTFNVKIDYPITITKGNKRQSTKEFKYTHPFNFDKVQETISGFMEEHQEHPDYIPIGYLSQAAHLDNFTFDISNFPNNIVVYSFFFPGMLDQNEQLRWVFAAKYEWEDLQ